MKLKNISKEELELMPFDDIAYMILKEKGKKIKTQDLFKIICDLLNLGEKEYNDRIADFFTLLATEKRFIQLDKGYWDLRENHTTKIDIKNIEEDLTEEDLISNEEEEELDADDYYSDATDTEDDKDDDDLKGFGIISDDIEDENDL